MNRIKSWLLLSLFFVVGCGSESPETTDNPQPDVEPKDNLVQKDDDPQPNASDKPPTENVDPKDNVPDPTPVKPANVPLTDEQKKLREQLSKLAENDGTGWHVNSNVKEQLAVEASSAIDDVVAAMSDKSANVRRGAAFFLLERIDETDAAMIDAFRAALADDDENIRHLGLTAFKRLPPDIAASGTTQLLALLQSSSESANSRVSIARLIANFETRSAEILPVVGKLASNDEDIGLRKACILAVGKLATPDKSVPVFQEVLKNETDIAIRRLAVGRLRVLGAEAAPAASELAIALNDDDETVRKIATMILPQLGKAAVEPLIAQLNSTNPRTRGLAIICLGSLGSDAKPAMLEISKRFEDENEQVRDLAMRTVELIKAAP